MARVVVLVPRRADGAHRDRLWEYVRGWWQFHGFAPVVGEHQVGPFCRSAALNTASLQAGGWDVAVLADADTVPDMVRVVQAIARAQVEPSTLMVPQRRFCSLTAEGTERVLAGKLAPHDAPLRWAYDNPKSSCLVVPRPLWNAVGGFDERFTGWGWEDAAFWAACQALGRVQRLGGQCWHLWHPRSPEKNPDRAEYRRNRALGNRYKAARRDARAMRQLVAR